ncbi:MAG: helix-turn-helix domain-containing protein, partial [Pseudomonadota bacterium]
MSKPIFSLQKGLDILCCFDDDHEVLSALEISERLNIPLSTTYRYLTVLVEKGFLAKDSDSNKYTLGYVIFQIGSIQSPRSRRL